MLSIEEIKKACEFADGFTWEIVQGMESLCYPYDLGFDFIDGLITEDLNERKNPYYELFLQRVVEGINKDYLLDLKGLYVEFKSYGLWVYDDNDNIVFETDFIRAIAKGFDPDQAKEQAIKYILEKL